MCEIAPTLRGINLLKRAKGSFHETVSLLSAHSFSEDNTPTKRVEDWGGREDIPCFDTSLPNLTRPIRSVRNRANFNSFHWRFPVIVGTFLQSSSQSALYKFHNTIIYTCFMQQNSTTLWSLQFSSQTLKLSMKHWGISFPPLHCIKMFLKISRFIYLFTSVLFWCCFEEFPQTIWCPFSLFQATTLQIYQCTI